MKQSDTPCSNLERFLKAQERDYSQALHEIRTGRKRSHWIWYIFPQLSALGYSETAKYYGIRDLAEANEYYRHPVLRSRLLEISNALLDLEESDPNRVMGYPDDLKLQSCMTLFSMADDADDVFLRVLQKFYGGQKDSATIKLLKNGN